MYVCVYVRMCIYMYVCMYVWCLQMVDNLQIILLLWALLDKSGCTIFLSNYSYVIAATMFCKNNLFNNITGFHFVKLPAQMGLNLD